MPGRKRQTRAEIRTIAKAERDLEVAAFLDRFADQVDEGRGTRACEVSTMARGLASSLRAGLVE